MDHNKVAELWNENSEAWQEASEKGHDIWRDFLNTPAFLKMLPDVSQLSGLDIGCGEGYNSRLIANRCTFLTCIDISDRFIASNKKNGDQKNISFQKINAATLPFSNNYFDFAISTMSFMDMAELDKVLAEIHRVLIPNGFLQFSIVHPCFNEQRGEWLKDENGKRIALSVKDYFKESKGEIHTWSHPASPAHLQFTVPRFWRPLSQWLNLLIKAGFILEEVCEPYADETTIERYPELSSTKIVAHSLFIRVKKR